MVQHRIEEGEELAHAGGERHLLCLPCSLQTLVEGANEGIEPVLPHDGAQIEDRTHLRPAAPDRAFAAQRAAITIQRRDADEGRVLFVRQRPRTTVAGTVSLCDGVGR